MPTLIAGLILFFAAHSVSIVNEPWRNRMAERLGEMGWQGLYSLVALAGFILIIIGYGQAQQTPIPLYAPPTWSRHAALLLMLPVFPLLVATYFPGRIQKMARHPMLLAVILWGIAHLMANGNIADLLLFGSFLLWALVDRISMTRRVQRPIQGAPATAWNDLVALIVGLGLYAAFIIWAHGWLFGVAPIA